MSDSWHSLCVILLLTKHNFLTTRYYQFSDANRRLLGGMSDGKWMAAWSKPATHPIDTGSSVLIPRAGGMYPLVSISRLGATPDIYNRQQNGVPGDTVACLRRHCLNGPDVLNTPYQLPRLPTIEVHGHHISTHTVTGYGFQSVCQGVRKRWRK
jgi:hypothetical protein